MTQPQTSASPQTPAAPRPRISGLAIASLVCGIVGPCTVGIASISGIFLGIAGLLKIGKKPTALRGRGLAIAGIVVSGVGLLLLPFLSILSVLLPAIVGALELANLAESQNNMKQVCVAAQQYAASHGEKLPPVDTWPQVFQQQLGLPPQVMAGPGDKECVRAYAMNNRLNGTTNHANSGRVVLFFECAPGSPPAGGPELLPEKPRHAGKYVIGFLDGHVEPVPPEDVENLVWEPGPGP